MQEEILKLFLFNKNIEKIDVVKPTGLITRFFAQGTLTKVELKSLTTLLKIILKEKGFILHKIEQFPTYIFLEIYGKNK